MNRHTDIEVQNQGLDSVNGQNVESRSLSNIVKGKEKLLCSEDLENMAMSQEKEIMYLREQIAIASVKESQLLNEKYSLERKFSELRMALDEKQNEAVTTALNELTRRKGDLEVNFNLLNELKATDDERHIFTTSMLGVLSEYGAWPHVVNASSLSNSIMNLHDQLQFRIRTSHARLLEMNSLIENDTRNGFIGREIPGLSSLNGQSSSHSVDRHGLAYSINYINEKHMEQADVLSRDADYDPKSTKTLTHDRHGLAYSINYINEKYMEQADVLSRNADYDPKSTKNLTHVVEMHHIQNNEILLKTSGFDRNETGTQAFDPSGMHNGIQSFGSEDDGPGIENFQIIGEAKPGCKLLGCGYPVRGTSLCMFQWVRHYPDGTRQYIEGATNPDYVVTADDVDKIIAVECIPMDERGRQGELVRIFANDHNKITCDEEMQEEIDSYTAKGQAKFNVLILLDSSENWEQATLHLKRSGFQVKLETSQTALIVEKYSEDLLIKIPGGLSTQFVLTCANGSSYPFSTSNDIRMRDKVVLTMGIFLSKALEEGRKAKA